MTCMKKSVLSGKRYKLEYQKKRASCKIIDQKINKVMVLIETCMKASTALFVPFAPFAVLVAAIIIKNVLVFFIH